MSDFSNELHTQIQYSLIEKLSQSERRYRELVDSLREIVFKCDCLGISISSTEPGQIPLVIR